MARISDQDQEFLDTWYRRDVYLVPAEYVLQPRKRRSEYEDYAHWVVVEDKLHKIPIGTIGDIDFNEEARLKIVASATHQEIAAGVLTLQTFVNSAAIDVIYLRSFIKAECLLQLARNWPRLSSQRWQHRIPGKDIDHGRIDDLYMRRSHYEQPFPKLLDVKSRFSVLQGVSMGNSPNCLN